MNDKLKLCIGAVFGFAFFYLINSFIQADINWIPMMYDGVSGEQVERIVALVIGGGLTLFGMVIADDLID